MYSRPTEAVARALVSCRPFIAPVILGALGAVLFLWHLGKSSYFLDESMSLREAQGGIGHALHFVRLNETSPPTYAVFLNLWLRTAGTNNEFVARLPSALAAVALVVAVWYLTTLLADAPTAFLAGLLTVCCPAVLQYAQQARVYAILMCVAALTSIAAVKAAHHSSGRWLALTGLGAIATTSLHYIGWLEVVPLATWVLLRGEFDARQKSAFVAALLLAGAAWLPEVHAQLTRFGNGGFGTHAGFTADNVLSLMAVPLFGRGAIVHADLIGAVGLGATLGLLARGNARAVLRDRALVVGLAVAPLAALVAVGAIGKNIVVPRYAAIAIPFILISVAAATRLRRQYLAAAAAALAVLPQIVGLFASLSPSSAYADVRDVTRVVAAQWRPHDFLYPDNLTIGAYLPLTYYAASFLPRASWTRVDVVYTPKMVAQALDQPVSPLGLQASYFRARERRARIWLVASYSGPPPSPRALVPPHYRVVETADFITSSRLRLVLAVPNQER